ncbi:MAG TPA: alpha/beta family hydrolase [Candidatus Limnocylindria bacterium]|nr:alpha/beta family hydrolase [Candidatus Limnocylindria bacterium]
MSVKVEPQELRFQATGRSGEVSALLLRPENASALLVFAHGAGAGMRHAFMEAAAHRLAREGIATFRYQFPYMEQRSGRPDAQPILLATVRSAIERARELAPDLPLIAGGKSMGGRMTSNAAAESPLPGVLGLVFFGFPLHAPGKQGVERGDHLARVTVPMLFLQGTRDAFADLALLRPLCDALGDRSTVHVVDGADHSFHVPKRSGRDDAAVLDELVDTCAKWAGDLDRSKT